VRKPQILLALVGWFHRLPLTLERLSRSPAIRARQANLRAIVERTGR
jgi:hypothetical protein